MYWIFVIAICLMFGVSRCIKIFLAALGLLVWDEGKKSRRR